MPPSRPSRSPLSISSRPIVYVGSSAVPAVRCRAVGPLPAEEARRRSSSRLAAGVVRYRWGGSVQLPGGAVAAGSPGSVQSVGMHGNFEVVAPLTTGGLAHWWRDNGVPAEPWHGPTPFGAGTFSAAAVVQNDNG